MTLNAHDEAMNLPPLAITIGLPLLAYLLGSIPVGLVLARRLAGIDIRRHGSGNIGATNVRRTVGNLPGALTLLGDALKGGLPVYLALAWGPPDAAVGGRLPAIVALAAFAGHLFPLYLGLRQGGKGVATAAGAFLVLTPAAGLTALLAFVLGLWSLKRVSAASLSAAAVLPLAAWLSGAAAFTTGCAALAALGIFFRHRANIARLIDGTEPTFRN